jgi:isopentenyl diphosphate isomerase/L-lactate dehydrogenase-like FMN-dependent dehydrogenase
VASIQFKLNGKVAPISVEDYRLVARRAVPGMVWAFIDGGAEDLVTLTANRESFAKWTLRANVLTGAQPTDIGVTIAGVDLSLPVMTAPTGMSGLSHWSGEMGTAQACERAGTRAVISTAASYSPEEIAAATAEDHFFQLYPHADATTGAREMTGRFIQRADSSGFRALFVTVDSPMVGNREAERKAGMTVSMMPEVSPARMLNAISKPRWVAGYLKHRRNAPKLLADSKGVIHYAATARAQNKPVAAPMIRWDDLAWMREQWTKPLFVKGILDPDDAARAVDIGADGIVVSNHGGRQIDGVMATIDALPAIAQRVGGQVPVLLDGGVRRGTDVVKALCLGASAVLVGRPHIYGLAADGTNGVEQVLEIFRDEILRTMTFMGVENLKQLDRTRLLSRDELPG